MTNLEDLHPKALINGLPPGGPAKIVHIQWFGDQLIRVPYERATGALATASSIATRSLPSRSEPGLPWSFDGDGTLVRLDLRPTESALPSVRPYLVDCGATNVTYKLSAIVARR